MLSVAMTGERSDFEDVSTEPASAELLSRSTLPEKHMKMAGSTSREIECLDEIIPEVSHLKRLHE
jgi:hypothetical protein